MIHQDVVNAIGGGAVGYIISDTSAVRSYVELFVRVFKVKTELFDPKYRALDFWTTAQMLSSNVIISFLLSMFSCGVCSSVVATVLFCICSGVFNVPLIFSCAAISIIVFSVIRIVVKHSNE